MSIKRAVRWSLRPKRIGVLIAKLVLAGSTDMAAQVALRVEVGEPAVRSSYFLEPFSPESSRYPMEAFAEPSKGER